MICLNLARTKRVLPFLLWNWHRLQIAWSVQCFARIGTMFEFVPMGVPIFGRKCPMFCTNWHDVQVCAFGWQIIWHEVSNILHELARCSSSCLWLARYLARSAQHLARSCTKLHEECTKKAVCFFVRVHLSQRLFWVGLMFYQYLVTIHWRPLLKFWVAFRHLSEVRW